MFLPLNEILQQTVDFLPRDQNCLCHSYFYILFPLTIFNYILKNPTVCENSLKYRINLLQLMPLALLICSVLYTALTNYSTQSLNIFIHFCLGHAQTPIFMSLFILFLSYFLGMNLHMCSVYECFLCLEVCHWFLTVF